VASLPTRIGLAAAAGIAALIVLGTTTWFLGDALMLLFVEKGLSPAGAAGLTGLAGLVIAILIGLLAKWLLGPRRRPAAAPAPAANVNTAAAELGAFVAQQLVTTTRAHPYKTMGAALAAGLAVGAIPELRKALTDLLKK
jgi:hypothetical protein